jgi:NAD(P)-dependent dehydrogenase (short-subunit alcohol dehydrogenase family)
MTEATMSLAGKRVIVIGGTSGIGFAVAALARELGAAVAIASVMPPTSMGRRASDGSDRLCCRSERRG